MNHKLRLAALYESGFSLFQDDSDQNPYGQGTTWSAIRDNEPTNRGEGKLVQLRLMDGGRVAAEVNLRDGEKPIYFRRMSMVLGHPAKCDAYVLGYEVIDADGLPVRHVTEVR